MNWRAVVLYGPPASGKDAVTHALTQGDAIFAHYRRLKVGTGRTDGYEMASRAAVAALRERGDVLFENNRYGNHYVVDRPRLRGICEQGKVPVVHLGQVAGVRAVASFFPAQWFTVLLWCSRSATQARTIARGSCDVNRRLRAWDETEQDLHENGTDDFGLCIDTERHAPEGAARLIRERVMSGVTG
jgi:guanylate kinase